MTQTKESIKTTAQKLFSILGDIDAVAAIMSYEDQKVTVGQIKKLVGNKKDPTRDYESRRFYSRSVRNKGVALYTEKHLSVAAASKKIGCAPQTLKTWLLEADVEFRDPRSILTVRSGHFKKLFTVPVLKPKKSLLKLAA